MFHQKHQNRPALLLFVMAGLLAFQTLSAREKPNVILFLVDDLGWTDIAAYGSDLHQTPNLDRLAKEGVRFTDAYSACTVCSPTRASIMTGKYPARLRLTDWISGHRKPFAKMAIPDWNQHLSADETTLAEAMKGEGYFTAHIGKWHLGENENEWPEAVGFDINRGGWSAGSPKANDGKGYFSPYNNPRLANGPDGEYLTERLAREAGAIIDQAKTANKPFFLNYWFYTVHTPLQARKEKIAKYEKLAKSGANHSNPVYAAMVEHLDDAVGVVMAKLKESGLDDNTVVIFTSDNGGLCGNYENNRKKVTTNVPLRSGKGDVFEGGVRVPLIVRWPGKIPAGKVAAAPAISPDLFPTVLDLAGADMAGVMKQDIDGRSLVPALSNSGTFERDAIFWHYPHYHLEGAKPYSAIRMGDWKLIQVYEEAMPKLFNLKDDIGEKQDLAETHPEIRERLTARLEQWKTSVKAQEPTPNPAYDPARVETWNIHKSATAASEEPAEGTPKEATKETSKVDSQWPESTFSKSLKGGVRILEEPGWNVWCCSPIRGDDGKVHVFFSRWPGGHDNWLSKSEIAHAVADRPEGPYTITGTILKGRGPGHWDADTIHNPTIQKVGDRYALFFIGNNLAEAERGKQHHASTQRIGLAMADKLEGPYIRVGEQPILDVAPDPKAWDSYLTTNPALLQHPNGQFWLYYKAWDRRNDDLRKMGVAIADKIEGPYQRHPANPLVSFASIGKQVEDAYVFISNDRFHMVMRDMGVFHPHVGLMLESADGLKWSEPTLGYRKNTAYFPTEKVERFERPQVLFTDGKPSHLFLALMGGKAGTSSAAVLEIDPTVFPGK